MRGVLVATWLVGWLVGCDHGSGRIMQIYVSNCQREPTIKNHTKKQAQTKPRATITIMHHKVGRDFLFVPFQILEQILRKDCLAKWTSYSVSGFQKLQMVCRSSGLDCSMVTYALGRLTFRSIVAGVVLLTILPLLNEPLVVVRVCVSRNWRRERTHFVHPPSTCSYIRSVVCQWWDSSPNSIRRTESFWVLKGPQLRNDDRGA